MHCDGASGLFPGSSPEPRELPKEVVKKGSSCIVALESFLGRELIELEIYAGGFSAPPGIRLTAPKPVGAWSDVIHSRVRLSLGPSLSRLKHSTF